MQVTDKDINRVEKLFFKDNGSFADDQNQRYTFIKCLDQSVDVEACPGSGKTTSLLAKLYLLSERMPFANRKGICVLTHTNVAIDEIKNRLGKKADKLFQYPNFFGTIQSFIDKYLAIPYYANQYKQRPVVIDTQRMSQKLLSVFLEYQIRDKVGLVKQFLIANELADKITFKRIGDGNYTIVKGINGDKIQLKKPFSKNADWSEEEKAKLFEVLFRMRKFVYNEIGILSYDDAYFLAQEYLIDQPAVRDAISARFSYVFIDEMQDTYAHQNEIINAIFGPEIIIQRIGDHNQAILNDSQSDSAWVSQNVLKITGSRRISQPIANVLRTVALNADPSLTGSSPSQIPPHILTYDDGNESIVLEKFAAIINEHNLDSNNPSNLPFKAIGWVSKGNKGVSLLSYFKSYNKSPLQKEVRDNLESAIATADLSNPKSFQNVLALCCVDLLRICKYFNPVGGTNKPFTKSTFLEYLTKNHPNLSIEFGTNIAKWYIDLASGKSSETTIEEVRIFLKSKLLNGLGIDPKKAEYFLDNKTLNGKTAFVNQNHNIFYSQKEHLKHIGINVGTVHSVKGETHYATLYLETSYQGKRCGEYLLDQLCGNTYISKPGVDKYKKSCLKVAHVGMSRPTHLLCVALNTKLVNAKSIELSQQGWKIV